jgi:hypothetical protein
MKIFALIIYFLLSSGMLEAINTRAITIRNEVSGLRGFIYFNGLDMRAGYPRSMLSRIGINEGEATITIIDELEAMILLLFVGGARPIMRELEFVNPEEIFISVEPDGFHLEDSRGMTRIIDFHH